MFPSVHAPMAPAPTVRARSGRGLGSWIAAVLLIGTLGFVAKDFFGASSGAPPVRPADLASLDPEVRELVESKLAGVVAEPARGDLHGDLGLVYEANELWDEATRSFANAARLDPGEALWTYHGALATERLGDLDAAMGMLEEAARRLPADLGVQLRLGFARLDASQLSGAREAFQWVAGRAPERPEGYAGLGEVALAEGRHEEAIGVLEKALGLEDAPRNARYTLGLAYRAAGRLDEAERELSIGEGSERQHIGDRFFPKVRDYAVYYAITIDKASNFLAAGRAASAVALLKGLLAHRPEDTNVLNNLAVAHLQQGELEPARNYLDKALKLDGEGFATHQNLAACFLQEGDTGRALEHAERAVELGGEVASTHSALSQVLGAMGRFDDAYISGQRASQLDPGDFGKRLVLAELCMQLRRYPEARERFRDLVARTPDHLPAHLNLIVACLACGDLEAGREWLGKVEALAPGHPRVAVVRQMVEDAQ